MYFRFGGWHHVFTKWGNITSHNSNGVWLLTQTVYLVWRCPGFTSCQTFDQLVCLWYLYASVYVCQSLCSSACLNCARGGAKSAILSCLVVTEFPTTRTELNAVFDIFDRNGTGEINYSEFMEALRPERQVRSWAWLLQLWQLPIGRSPTLYRIFGKA